jgi:hypothetical protein
MSAIAHFYRMDTTRPHLWWISCERCHRTGVAHLQRNDAVWCTKCNRHGKIQVVIYRSDSLKFVQWRVGMGICFAGAALAGYLIFFG